MSEWLLGLASAAWLGVLTSVSPCPLTTNIAAVSYLARDPAQPRHALWSGIWYALGRSTAYVGISAVLSTALLSAPGVSLFLQEYANRALGPLLVLVGLVLLGAVQFDLSWRAGSERLGALARRWGALGAAGLGAVFALSFCPVSAALFFGSLLPLSVMTASVVGVPLVYGIGTALPVLVFARLMTAGLGSLGRAFDAAQRYEHWARRGTAVVVVIVGIYCTVVYTVGAGS